MEAGNAAIKEAGLKKSPREINNKKIKLYEGRIK